MRSAHSFRLPGFFRKAKSHLIIGLGLAMACSAHAQFIHPGIIHSQDDLDLLKTKVSANEEPWASGYAAFSKDSRSQASYSPSTPKTYITRSPIGSVNLTQWENECGAAYQNAIQWTITGNATHAAKARQILIGWASTCTVMNGSDARLTAGLQGHKFIAAAEILRRAIVNGSTYSGWSASDTATTSQFIQNVLLPLNRMHGGGNWGIIGAISQMSAGVFLDDQTEYQNGLDALKFGSPTEADMGINNYINPGGWTTEADRDIGHWALGINNINVGAQIAWCQGDDLWTYLGNRLATAQEYINQYNAGETVVYTAGTQADGIPNGNLTIIGRGRWDISYQEQTYYPYRHYFGIAMPKTDTAVTQTRAFFAGNTTYTAPDGTSYSGWYNDGIYAERYDRDHTGFGTLLFPLALRNEALPTVPGTLSATWGNNQATITWSASATATSYRLQRASTRSGPFTTIANNLSTTSFTDTTASNGQTYYYRTFAINAAGLSASSGLITAYPLATAPVPPSTPTATATTQNRIDLTWPRVPGATSYVVKRSTTASGPFTTVASGIGTPFPRYVDSGLSPGSTYYYTLSSTNSLGTGSASSTCQATTLAALPAGWIGEDAGYQTTPGSGVYQNGTFTVKGAGLDYGGAQVDSFGFTHTTMTGDGEIIARLASRDIYSHLSKIGIVLRESTAGNSKHAFLLLDGTNTAKLTTRASTGASGISASTTLATSDPPLWLKLTRAGTTFTGSISTDGSTWTTVASATLTMNTTLLAGFAVCSRNNGRLDTATFDHVSITGWTPPSEYTHTYPAEDTTTASYGGGSTLDSNNAGFNGTGYINFSTSGGYLQFNNIQGNLLPATLRIRYALKGTSRTGLLIINGSSQSITFNPTGQWTTFLTMDLSISLNPTYTNTIRFQSNGQDLANIDEITIILQPTPPITAEEIASVRIAIANQNPQITLLSPQAGHSYQLQTSDTLLPNSWQNLGTSQTGSTTPLIFPTNTLANAPHRFYRIVIGN